MFANLQILLRPNFDREGVQVVNHHVKLKFLESVTPPKCTSANVLHFNVYNIKIVQRKDHRCTRVENPGDT